MPNIPPRLVDRCTYRSEWRRPWCLDLRKPRQPPKWAPWVRDLRGKSGVYIVREIGEKRVAYVGRGRKNLKAAFVRHCHAWGQDPRGPHHRVIFDREKIEVKVYYVVPEWVPATEADMIALHRPVWNTRLEAAHATIKEVREPGADEDEDPSELPPVDRMLYAVPF